MKQKLNYDLLVIGAGAAGFYAAREAARAGLKTAIVEKNELGGTAFYWGSLPVKMIADKIKAYQKTKKLLPEFKSELKKVDFLLQAADFKKIEAKIKKDLSQAGADLFYGEGHFNSAHEFELKEKLIQAERIILASGSKVKTKADLQLGQEQIISHKEAVSFKKLPESMLIIGMNIEGAEFASIFSFLGVKVYILDQKDSLLPGIDQDLTKVLKQELEKNGVEIMTSTTLKKAEITEFKNQKVVKAELESNLNSKQTKTTRAVQVETAQEVGSTGAKSLIVDKILFTAGREANFPAGIEKMQLAFNKQGLQVNSKLQTTNPAVYALGDLNGNFGIASTAINDALIAVNELKQLDIFKNKLKANYKKPVTHLKTAVAQTIPLNIFTLPEIGGFGLSETQLKAKNTAYRVQKYYFKDCWRSLISQKKGFVKIMLAAESEKILGVYFVGDQLSEIVSSLSLTADLELKDLLENIYIQPTRTEILREAALMEHKLGSSF
jgi:dihydrolipoamide dehydrogenase